MGTRQVLVHTRSLGNLMSALMERLYYEKQTQLPPAPTKAGHIARTLRPFTKLLVRRRKPATPMLPKQFVECYSGRKRRIYEQAAVTYTKFGVTQKDAQWKAFVKFEKILEQPGERVVPRLINPRSAVYNVGLGRYLRPLEHKIYHRIQKCFEDAFGVETPVVAKGFNAEQSAQLIWEKFSRFDDPCVVGLDASRFDQHVNVEMLRWEHSIYKAYYPQDPELADLLEMQIHNRGIAVTPQGTVRFSVDGTRGSGDMNTALGNCLISAAILWSFAKRKRMVIDCFINGDDVIVFMDRAQHSHFIDGLAKFYMDLGFRMKVEPAVTIMEHIDFCQTRPVFDGIRWVMVRAFPDCISKDSTIIHHVFAGDGWKDYLASVGDCGLSLCGGLPVLEAYYKKLRSLGKPRDTLRDFITSGFQAMAHGLARASGVSDAARESFDRAFNVPSEVQKHLEVQIEKWQPGEGFGYQEPHVIV